MYYVLVFAFGYVLFHRGYYAVSVYTTAYRVFCSSLDNECMFAFIIQKLSVNIIDYIMILS